MGVYRRARMAPSSTAPGIRGSAAQEAGVYQPILGVSKKKTRHVEELRQSRITRPDRIPNWAKHRMRRGAPGRSESRIGAFRRWTFCWLLPPRPIIRSEAAELPVDESSEAGPRASERRRPPARTGWPDAPGSIHSLDVLAARRSRASAPGTGGRRLARCRPGRPGCRSARTRPPPSTARSGVIAPS